MPKLILNESGNVNHTPSGKGDGKWESKGSLSRYKKKKERKNKQAKASRKANRR